MAPWSGVRGGGRRGKRQGLVALGVAASLLGASGATARAHADEAFRCELEQSRGVSPEDARTAADLLCGELRRASGGRGGFKVSLATLGKIVVVTATREEPAGSVSVQLDALEEVPTAAPRVADALAQGLGFATTQRVDNLLEGETRPVRAKKGSVKFSIGVADVESVGHGARAAGFSLGLMYATPRFALPVDMRFGLDDAPYPEKELGLFSLSVGGRVYTSRKDVSPFFGGGLGVLNLHASEGEFPEPGATSGYFYADRFGVAPYVEAGVEMLRLHRGRVALLVRADFPTAALRNEAVPTSYWDGREWIEQKPPLPVESRYVVPVTIGVQVAF